MMNIEKEREDFERFAAKNGWFTTQAGWRYRSDQVTWMWLAWRERASMQAKDSDDGNQEPFGYFRATPFGWEDCAPTDEGAMALYERPQTSSDSE